MAVVVAYLPSEPKALSSIPVPQNNNNNPPLGIYPKEIKSVCRRDICTYVFIVALLKIASVWNQPVSINRSMYIIISCGGKGVFLHC
jgi:hypothetical protein